MKIPRIKAALFHALLSLCTLFNAYATPPTQENLQAGQHMEIPCDKPEYLVIGTRNIAYSIIKGLLDQNKRVTVLAYDKKNAQKLFGSHERLEIVQGAVEKDSALVKTLALGKKYIFYAPYFPQEKMGQLLARATAHVIQAATPGSIVLFPSRNYSLGNVNNATEETPVQPCSKIGQIFNTTEKTLLNAATSGGFKTVILRHSHAFGPNVIDGLMDKVFTDLNKQDPVQWVHSTNIGYQICYAPDVADLMIRLAHSNSLQAQTVLHFGGSIIDPIESWLQDVADVVDTPLQVRTVGWMAIAGMAMIPGRHDAAACKDIFYSFQNTITLNDTKIRAMFPDFAQTEMNKAIVDTLAWFRK